MIIKTKLSNKDIDIEKTHQITDFGETHILRGCYVPYSLTDYCFWYSLQSKQEPDTYGLKNCYVTHTERERESY